MNASEPTERLFSYGTLQEEAVQLSTFGRRLQGAPDSLIGYKIQMIPIHDQHFIATSGASHHRNLDFTGNKTDVVEGYVFAITKRELEQADAYEPKDYKRVQARLRSGLNAWIYLSDLET